jgi:integrase
VRRSRTRPRYEHGCQPNCGHKYAGHCPSRQNVRPLTDTTKSRAGKRIVPLPGAIVDLLLAHGESQSAERQRAAQLWSEEGWIFADETGRAVNPRTDWDGWKRLLATAGVRDGRLRDARHTAATVLLLLGVHERTAMSVLGWSTTAMVSRYAHVIAPIHSDVASRGRSPCGGPSVSPCQLAVAEGFEPSEAFTSRAFEARSLGRSDTPPPVRLPKAPGASRIA